MFRFLVIFKIAPNILARIESTSISLLFSVLQCLVSYFSVKLIMLVIILILVVLTKHRNNY